MGAATPHQPLGQEQNLFFFPLNFRKLAIFLLQPSWRNTCSGKRAEQLQSGSPGCSLFIGAGWVFGENWGYLARGFAELLHLGM